MVSMIGFHYKSELPWEAKTEIQRYFADISSKYDGVVLIANSIEDHFLLKSLSGIIEKAMFLLHIVIFERLIFDMTQKANISEKELGLKKVINMPFGESLS